MSLLSLPTQSLLDRFASSDPTPGGGSAAALAGAMAAALVEMVAAMPKTRTGTPEEREKLDGARAQAAKAGARLRELVDLDTAAYNAVMAAFKLPKATDDEKAVRKNAIADATRLATETPLETVERGVDVLRAAAVALSCGNENALSDVRTAMSLCRAAIEGGTENVRINLTSPSIAKESSAYLARLETLLATVPKKS